MRLSLSILFLIFAGCTDQMLLQLKDDNSFSGGLSTIRYLGNKQVRLATSTESVDANEVLKSELNSSYTDLNQDFYLKTGGRENATMTIVDNIELVSKEDFSSIPLAIKLSSPRYLHSTTKLLDGRVLILGGLETESDFVSEIEIFDPISHSISLSNASLNFPRAYHTATLLPDGRVLIMGGYPQPNIEIYDPFNDDITAITTPIELRTYNHTAVLLEEQKILVSTISGALLIYDVEENIVISTGATLGIARRAATATLLKDGKVLFVAGNNGTQVLDSLEIYDPVTNLITESGTTLFNKRNGHAAFLREDGQVVILGGLSNLPITYLAEFYNPETDRITGLKKAGIYLNVPRYQHSTTLLNDGRVLFIGGSQQGGEVLSGLEAYEIETNLSERLNTNLNRPRYLHTATLLKDGKVLIVGGNGAGHTPLSSLEIYDPIKNTLSELSIELNYARSYHNAILMKDGRVLITGGLGANGEFLEIAEIYDPESHSIEVINSGIGRATHVSTLLEDGRILYLGGISNNGVEVLAEVYDPETKTFSVHSSHPLPAFYFAAAAKLFDGRVLIVGGLDGDSLPFEMMIYDPIADSISIPNVSLNSPARSGHGVVLLADGRVLIAGGIDSRNATFLMNIEIYNPVMYFAKVDLKVTGGKAPYSFEVLSGEAEIVGGKQVVGTKPGIVKMRCEDADGIALVFEVEFYAR